MSQIYLTTLNLTDSSVIFSIDGARYEYFTSHEALRRIELASRRSTASALNLAKRKAVRWQKLEAA